MNYNSIITDLAQTSEKVQNWAKQGFVPSIEKDSVLASIRKIYDELSGGCNVSLNETIKPAESETANNQIKIVDGSSNRKEEQQSAKIDFTEIKETIGDACNSGVNTLKEYIDSNKLELIQEITSLKETISQIKIEATTALLREAECDKKAEAEKEETAVEEEKKEETVTNIKVDINPPIMGFHSLPEYLQTNIVHELFEDNVARAETSVNKMCSLKSVDELLIYIEEHYSWNPESSTAIELINYLSKKF